MILQSGALIKRNKLDHPFQFHSDLNTNYFKVQLVPMHKYEGQVLVPVYGPNILFNFPQCLLFKNVNEKC